MIEIVRSGPNQWTLLVNGNPIIASWDEGVCKRYARIVEHCRNIPYRVAIRTLMDDIGFCEDNAKLAYIDITEHPATGAMN